MFRTRIEKDIVIEFLTPSSRSRREKIILLCDGMPSIPRKQGLATFLSEKGYWVFYPRYRGAWESGGQFLARSPHQDILEVIDALEKPIVEVTFGKRFQVKAEDIFVVGGSFGGAASILCSLDARVSKVVANCPVVDWSILPRSERAETSNPSYVAYLREAFGNAYRLSEKNWNKLRSGTFYNPAHHIAEITAKKILMFHAVDDPYVPYTSVRRFAEVTGVTLKSFARGGHIGTEYIVRRHWKQIESFFRKRDEDE